MRSNAYKEKIKKISKRIVLVQKPIRILDAIKWDDSVQRDFFASRFKKLPQTGETYYQNIPLGFNPDKKENEFKSLITDIRRDLGQEDDVGNLLIRNCKQYIDVVRMLASRGTKKFWEYSKKLYGSPKDQFFSDTNNIASLGALLHDILSGLNDKILGTEDTRDKSSEEVVKILKKRFHQSFLHDCVEVKLSDGIVADAAAGSNYIKINRFSLFSNKDIDILEVHEGWVHVATTANGANQPHAVWLEKGPPRCTVTQEGLAVFMEVITFRTYPRRARKINDRILGIDMAEDGADALELFWYYQNQGYSEEESYRNMMRICRGGLSGGGAPFTKDICYCQGFIENYNFIRTAIRKGKPELIRFLFAGKLHVRDVPMIYQKYQEGLVSAPIYLPPPLTDLSGLAVWMSFSNFLNQVDLKAVQNDYERLFKKFL